MIDFIFIVLVYRNIHDLDAFLTSLGSFKPKSKVIVVESFYDEATTSQFEDICLKFGCDFIGAKNQGYGKGNNIGIAYAKEHYQFKFLIVANPDTEIKRFDWSYSETGGRPCIYGPMIKTSKGKRQNPCMVIFSPLRESLMREYARVPMLTPLFYAAVAINKLERIIFNLFFGQKVRRVYSLHGSFLIFSFEALQMIGEPFHPAMFLFREEDYLARLARSLKIKMVYCPKIQVLHKEDGSVKFMSESVRAHTIASLRAYFGISSTFN